MALESWGRFPKVEQAAHPIYWAGAPLPARRPLLAFGLGRSYGDVCLNAGGTLLTTRTLDRFKALDVEAGTLSCEAGVTLGEILELVVPKGFFLPVVPGTKHVTVGGAIANDVHGKNHHREGTFGRHVLSLELLRSERGRVRCGPAENPELFAATVGGLGLTGLILAATVRLRRIRSPYVEAESLAMRDLDHFFELAEESDRRSEFTVAWIDCLAKGARIGRGIMHRGSFTEEAIGPSSMGGGARLAVPCELPFSPLNRLTIAAFNLAYRAANARKGQHLAHAGSFFFPLDGVERWNRIYGRRGLLQFQCTIPAEAGPATIRELLGAIAKAGQGSFLAVLKRFGEVASPGLLSFPRPGVTLALDFPYRGEQTDRLFGRLHAVAEAGGGAFYPAKDAHMSAAAFARSFPRLELFRQHLDPAFSSSFWRRVDHRD